MDRINTATKAVDLYGAGKHGFKNSNATLGTPATDLNAEWANGVTEEHLNLIEGAGLVPALATLTQVRQAVKRLAGANVRTITVVGPTALTADDAGLIVLDATANAVTITLPAANLVVGVPLQFQFVRIDTSANAVTINRAGADTFVGGATSFVLVGQGDTRTVRSDATSKWATLALSALGYAQTWQNVIGSRAVGTNYTNTTGRPIEVLVMANTTAAAGAVLTTVVGGVTLGAFAGLYSASGGASAIAQFVVPSGTVYSVAMSGGGSPVLASWVELR